MNQGELPLAYEKVESNSQAEQRLSAARGTTDLVSKVQKSALWAAYGDAIGWISELTDEAGLRRRTGGAELVEPIDWKRRIGGRSGVLALLPKGCYSDDSQLRLATGRAIRPDAFDIEMFSKIELPIWLSYALGGGKSTSAAAENLARPKVRWFANTYKGWFKSGGNGAAMRIQPHVWAARTPENPDTFLPDVVRNAVCTHSHPNGLLGACLHALTLAHAMATESHLSPDDLMKAVEVAAASVPEVIQKVVELGQFWLVTFERDAGEFNVSWEQAIEECREAVRIAAGVTQGEGADRYDTIINELRLRDPNNRGSGVLTSIAAVALLWCESRPREALRIAANALGTDTDTIATMSGAILGAATQEEPPIEVLDADLFRAEAKRLAEIAHGGRPVSPQYPDLIHWGAPRTRSDALSQTKDGRLYVHGLGLAEALCEPKQSSDPGFKWQWIKLGTGQTLFIKRRRELAVKTVESIGPLTSKALLGGPVPVHQSNNAGMAFHKRGQVGSRHTDLPAVVSKEISNRKESSLDILGALKYLKEHKGDDLKVGKTVRRVFRSGTTEQILAFLPALMDCMRSSDDEE